MFTHPSNILFPLLLLAMNTVAGEDSSNLTITLKVPALVSISQLEDIDLGSWSGQGGLDAANTVCVWSSVEEYSLTASSGSARQGRFTLASAEASQVHYQAFWNDGSGFRELQHDELMQDLASSAESRDCSNDDTAKSTLRIEVPESTLDASTPGQYADVLTLTVTAE